MAGTRRFAFSSLLFVAMGAATFTASSLGILATFIIDDLSISRAELGVVLAVVNIAAAVLSPVAGRITDRIGGKAAIVALFVIAGATFLLLGTAVGYVMLLAGALTGAFSQASANPATNKLIAEDLPAGERGLITGGQTVWRPVRNLPRGRDRSIGCPRHWLAGRLSRGCSHPADLRSHGSVGGSIRAAKHSGSS